MKALSLLLASLLLLQACAGSVSRRQASLAFTEEPEVIQTAAAPEDTVPEEPKRRWWPWVVGGVAVVAVGTVILLAVAFHNLEFGAGAGFDVFGGSGSGDRDRNDDGGGTLPVIASR